MKLMELAQWATRAYIMAGDVEVLLEDNDLGQRPLKSARFGPPWEPPSLILPPPKAVILSVAASE